jgi:hypothetical protein
VVRSPSLVADGAIRDGCRGVTRCATDRRMIRVTEV